MNLTRERRPCLNIQFGIAQCLLVDQMKTGKNSVLLQLTHANDHARSAGEPNGETNVADMQVDLIGHENHKAGIGVVFDPDTHALAATQAYFVAQINLFAELCRGRNEGCAALLIKKMPIYSFQVIHLMISKDMFPPNLRAAFCRLMLSLYLDSYDFQEEQKFPMLVRPNCPF